MALEDRVRELRTGLGGTPPLSLQGVTKDRIRAILAYLDLAANEDLRDAIFALLDDENASWFSKAPKGAKISDGASTAHLACHVGILQRNAGKLDREGRDHWIKPMRELGGIEAITLEKGEFLPGHVVAKSPNSAYRLEKGLHAILLADDGDWTDMLADWAAADATRGRRTFQAEMAAASAKLIAGGHADLIQSCVEHYAKRFLPDFEVLYVDDADGDRITEGEREKMRKAGVELTLGDAMPDVLLWNPKTDWLWVIEAVTSDGEVDLHKLAQVTKMASRCGKAGIGCTTAYRTWREAAARQGVHRNIAPGTLIWIQGDPAKVFEVKG